jgi:type II secretory pathway pseudopilin PulG
MRTTTASTNESGMTLMAVMVFLSVFAFVLMMAAPSVYIDVQREKELESIRRGEEIANAIYQYCLYNQGRKLPTSLDDLLEGLPDGTKKRQILRASAVTDPLSLDGEWRLISPDPETIASFAKRVQAYNNGVLPTSPPPRGCGDQYAQQITNILNTGTEDEVEDEDTMTDANGGPFIGVASKSTAKSVLTYYGIEKHSNWLFTPMFRGTSASTFGIRPPTTR